MSPKKFTLTFPDCISTANAFLFWTSDVPKLDTALSRRQYPRLTQTKILPFSVLAHAVAPSKDGEPHSIPSKSSSAMPTVAEEASAFIPTPATELGEILSPVFIGPFSKDTFVGTLPERATAGLLGLALYIPPMNCKDAPSIVIAGLVETMPITASSVFTAFFTLNFEFLSTVLISSGSTASQAGQRS